MSTTTVKPKLWQLAASYAARAHNHQYRKDKKTPFVAHPFRVAMVLRDIFGCDDEVAIATALLHDTIEDTPTDFDDIHKRFGRDVAVCVACMTKNMLLIEPEREKDYDERLAKAPWQARIVKLADVYDNSLDLPRPGMRKKCIARCQRALVLTENDTGREEFVAGRAAVRDILDSLKSVKE